MEQIRQKSWFSRNWGWVLGGGCLTMIVIAILGVIGLVFTVTDSITESEPYTYAYKKASEDEKVLTLLGTPIETNGMGSTNFNYKNGESKASLVIPIKGPDNEGQIIVKGNKIDDEWSYTTLYVAINNVSEPINLLDTEIEAELDDF